jgi:nucleoside-diphosphate-sugar epimerase
LIKNIKIYLLTKGDKIMRVVVIGGTGHVGTYLVPKLIGAGHEVINLTRGKRMPYHLHKVWKWVQNIEIDRETEEASGTFGKTIAGLKPDVVIDLICFKLESAKQLVESIKGNVQQLLHCGTLWVHGPNIEVPATEKQKRRPFCEYGIRKAAIEGYLIEQARMHRLPVTILHPGHIVGSGWMPVNPAANFNPEVFEKLAKGEELELPNLGMETVHHVHADDVAQAFLQAMANWSTSCGESFHIASPKALTLRGYAETAASWFGKEANLKFLPWNEWCKTVSQDDAEATWDHIAHSPNCSIEKAKRLINYNPRYSSLEAIYESVIWLIENDKIKV